MTIARAHLVDPAVTRWYHCVSLGSVSLGRVDLGGQPPRSTRPDARTPMPADPDARAGIWSVSA